MKTPPQNHPDPPTQQQQHQPNPSPHSIGVPAPTHHTPKEEASVSVLPAPGNHHKKEDSLIDLSEDYMKQSQPEPDLPVARLNPVQEEPYQSAAWNQNSQESSAGVATTSIVSCLFAYFAVLVSYC